MGFECNAFYKGVGCRGCRNTGYKGRIGVHELLVLNDDMRDAIVANPNVSQLRKLALREGMVELRADGFRKVREGITTVEEILHIAGDLRDPASGA
jgi:type IV pilus assembly protein PilB